MRHIYFLILLALTACGSDLPLPDMVCENGSVCDVGDDPTVPVKNEPIVRAPLVKSDPYFTPWIQHLQQRAFSVGRLIDLSNVPIVFGDTSAQGSKVVAYCTALNNGQRVVYVNPSFWVSSKETTQLLILTHEIGHCSVTLNRAHNYDFRRDGTPLSIMYMYLLKESVYLQYEADYWDEYFNNPFPQLNWRSAQGLERNANLIMTVDPEENDVPIVADHSGENGTDCTLNMGEDHLDEAVDSNASSKNFTRFD